MASEKLQHRFATIAQHKRLTRVLYVSLYALLGGTLGVFFTRFIEDVKTENWLRFPTVVALATCLILVYEGHRRYRAIDEVKQTPQVRDLWLSAVIVSALSFVFVLPFGSLALHLPRWMGCIVLGLYVGTAMIGMLLFDFAVRPRVAAYQVIAAISCSAMLYILISFLQLSPSEDLSILLHALAISIALAIAYAVIPRYFDDMCVYVIDGSDAKVRMKIMKSGSGFWSMASGQKHMDIVDGTVNAVNDPKAILLPEALVPEVASIRRKDRQFVLALHERNNDVFRRGEVHLDDELLQPNREYPLKTGSRIRVGSLVLGIIVPRTGILAAALLLLLGGVAHSQEQPVLTSYHKWYKCDEVEKNPFAVASVVLTSENAPVPTSDLTVRVVGEGVSSVVHRYQPLLEAKPNDARIFLTTANIQQAAKDAATDVYYFLLLDYSGSMGWSATSTSTDFNFDDSRWMRVMHYLDQEVSLFSNNSAMASFDCWGPSKDDIARMNFTAQVPSVLKSWHAKSFFARGAAANNLFGIKSPDRPPYWRRGTRLYATLVSTLQGLVERTRQTAGAHFKLIVFSDGLNDEKHCAAPAAYMTTSADGNMTVVQPQPSECADLHRELEAARETGRIDVVLVSHAPTASEGKDSLATCVRWKYPKARCAPCQPSEKECVSFPRLCAATEDQASWSKLLVSVGRDTIQMGAHTELFLRPDEVAKYHEMSFSLYQKEGAQQRLLARTVKGGYAYELGDISRLPTLSQAGICAKLAHVAVKKIVAWPWYYFVPLTLGFALLLLLLWRVDGYLSQRFFA